MGLENELATAADGWVRIAPWGDSVKSRIVEVNGERRDETFIQRLTPEAGAKMAALANSLWGQLKRWRRAVPVYARHPDLKRFSPSVVANERAAAPVGVLSRLEDRGDGLYGLLVLTEAGQTAVENEGLKFLSPFWWVAPVGAQNGTPVVEPVEMISVGLTDRPNIAGGEPLANQKEETGAAAVPSHNQNETQMKKQLIKLLALAGVALANEADDTAVAQGVKQAEEALAAKTTEATALANEKAGLATGNRC